MRIVPATAFLVVALLGTAAAADPAASAPALPWHLVREYPHDISSFTEGLVLDGKGRLIESSGEYGQSELAIRDLASGRAIQTVKLAPTYFGEGVTLAGQQIFQLTWREHSAFVYDLKLNKTGQFEFNGEGWGLSWDGHHLIQSDGTSSLYFIDPKSFITDSHITVRDGDNEVILLNELEYARGRIYANVWHSNRIAVIVPETGQVERWIDLTQLQESFPKPADWDPSDNVLNGIAYEPRSGHLYVTGKRWPKLFEIALDAPAVAKEP